MRTLSRGAADELAQPAARLEWRILVSLAPYLLEFPVRVAAAAALLILAKLANVLVPVALKYIVDHFEQAGGVAATPGGALVVVPVALIVGYGLLRFASTFFGELRDLVFARVAERAMRRIAQRVFEHLHRMDLAFHLDRQTGALARDIERGTSGISFLLRFLVFNILPTLLEIALVAGILAFAFGVSFLLAVAVAVVVYVVFSVWVTEWRTRFVREANLADNDSSARAIDSLLNVETVRHFNNQAFEARRYDAELAAYEKARLKSTYSLVVLNSGQALIIAASITVMIALAAHGVASGRMTLGDLVMVNAYMIQLFLPLNFLGFVYREIRQSLANIERLFGLLDTAPRVSDRPGATTLTVTAGRVVFDRVSFAYPSDSARAELRDGEAVQSDTGGVEHTVPAPMAEADPAKQVRVVLDEVSFVIEPGERVAVVGPSGAGKSTLARLLFRFYDPTDGRITIDGQDLREVSLDSVQRAIGVVPQEAVLFNETIRYNVAYGRPGATESEILEAVERAHLSNFVAQLPDGLDTRVGERGLKVSGGEKQRIAIARMLLKNPPIVILDEATSSLDSTAERAVLEALSALAEGRTSLTVAHRLATIRDADRIVVMEAGRVVESGRHDELLERDGAYARLWHAQHRRASSEGSRLAGGR